MEEQQAEIHPLIRSHTLNAHQLELLLQAFNDFQAEACLQQALYDALLDRKVNYMKEFNIILCIVLLSFTSVVYSQEIKDGFKIYTVKNITLFEDVKRDDFRGFPLINEKGESLSDPSATLSSKEKLKKIESDLFTEEEQNYLRLNYKPRASVIVSANDGKIVSVSFGFENLPDSSVIDTKKLKELQKRIINELTYENLLFNGQKAVSGYIWTAIWLFRP